MAGHSHSATLALLALLAAPCQAQTTDTDLRMAGECGALGAAVMLNANSFPDTTWRQAALVLMFSPAVLADAKLEVPFKDHPVYRKAMESTQADLAAQPPSPSNPAYSSRLKPCLDWANKLPALEGRREKP